jgi:ribosomal protein S18 acetylase RimI-like enzyme
MAIRIRPAEIRDLATLAHFALALADVHVQVDDRRFVVPDGGEHAFFQFFSTELERPEAVLLVAENDSTPIGYAFIRMEPASIEGLCKSSAWLHDVYVDPLFRGRGVGRQLVLRAIESARQLGSSSLMLGVSPANTQARQLYERLGMHATMIEMHLDFD